MISAEIPFAHLWHDETMPSAIQWYCPKCGELVVEKSGLWECSSGGLQFSEHLGGRLAATYGAAFIPGRKPAVPMQIETLFCPACCVAVDREYACPECGRGLRPFIFELIEFHPHADGRGSWL